MGIIRAGITFSLGAVWGMYVAQNYYVPDIKRTLDTYVFKAKELEETHRKNLETDKPESSTKP